MKKFRKAALEDKEGIFKWLDEPHMKEFWDNSPNHRKDILIFMNGRKEPSPYFDGIFDYWIGCINETPYCLIMTSVVLPDADDLPEIWKDNLSKNGKTFTIDFAIGNTKFLGKGLASSTLDAFTQFFHQKVDPQANTFFIDPEELNAKAKHVYEKAGFQTIGHFYHDFDGRKEVKHFLMVKKIK